MPPLGDSLGTAYRLLLTALIELLQDHAFRRSLRPAAHRPPQPA